MKGLEEIKDSINEALNNIAQIEHEHEELQKLKNESIEHELCEFEDHISALWINIHDVATEAIENPKDIEVQIRSFVKLNALTRCVMDALSIVEFLDNDE